MRPSVVCSNFGGAWALGAWDGLLSYVLYYDEGDGKKLSHTDHAVYVLGCNMVRVQNQAHVFVKQYFEIRFSSSIQPAQHPHHQNPQS